MLSEVRESDSGLASARFYDRGMVMRGAIVRARKRAVVGTGDPSRNTFRGVGKR